MAEDLLQKHRARILNYCFMDDIFFSVCFDGNISCVQYILRIILDKQDLIVEEVHSQQSVEIIYGRSVRLDVLAKDSTGKIYDIEIQRTDTGAIPQRARYNSSMLDCHSLNKGEDYKILPETYVIFITENDVLKGGEQIYFIERTIQKSGKLFNDGSHIVYVPSIGHWRQKIDCVELTPLSFVDGTYKHRPIISSDEVLDVRLKDVFT